MLIHCPEPSRSRESRVAIISIWRFPEIRVPPVHFGLGFSIYKPAAGVPIFRKPGYSQYIPKLLSFSHSPQDGHPCAIKSVDLEKTDPEVARRVATLGVWKLRDWRTTWFSIINHMAVSIIGVPLKWMFIRETPIKMDDLGVPPFVETSIYFGVPPF